MKRKILIYSTSWCQPCKLAKKLLQERGLDFQEIDIEEKGWSREDLFDITGGRTVPQVVINDDTIGGYDDLVSFGTLLKEDVLPDIPMETLKEILPEWKHPKTKEPIDSIIDKLSDIDKKSILKIKKP